MKFRITYFEPGTEEEITIEKELPSVEDAFGLGYTLADKRCPDVKLYVKAPQTVAGGYWIKVEDPF